MVMKFIHSKQKIPLNLKIQNMHLTGKSGMKNGFQFKNLPVEHIFNYGNDGAISYRHRNSFHKSLLSFN